MAIITPEDCAPAPLPGAEQRATLGMIPEGVAGIRATLAAMVSLTKQARTDPAIRLQAESLLVGVPQKSARREVRAIFEFVRDSIRYTSDVCDVETLKSPELLLQTQQGDCDDKSMLVAALLGSVGYYTRFVAVCTDTPGLYSHVYAEVKLGADWYALETTEDVPFGWRCPYVGRPLIAHV